MASVWILHDDDGPYGIVQIHGVYATRDLAVKGAQKRALEDMRNKTLSMEWQGNRLIQYYRLGWELPGDMSDELVGEITEYAVVSE